MTTAASCHSCGAAVGAADQFCESCGSALTVAGETPAAADVTAEARTHLLAPPLPAGGGVAVPAPRPPCGACGGAVDEGGWCTVCGLRAPSERDHWIEQPAPWVAGVCDRGKRHARNEDAMAIAAGDAAGSFCAVVVCDGVTTAAASDVAALAAARAALDSLTSPRDTAGLSPATRIVFWTERLEAASRVANDAASAVAATVAEDAEPPSCTFVAAVLDGPVAVAGWVGDSRAYWLPDSGAAMQMTVDDSWATDQIALGMAREAAEADARAHAITRWLGADSDGAVARCASMALDGPGWLLVCSDGLWNYCSPADELRALIDAQVAIHGTDPGKVAAALVTFANDAGGHDNITAGVAHVPATHSTAQGA
jgi:serine/threonine protein phosphatase PrpC